MKKIQIRDIILISCVLGIIFQSSISFGESVRTVTITPKSIQGQLSSQKTDQWEDTEYDFYLIQVAYEESAYISLEYEGTLDLDMVIFFDELALDENQKKFAWDVTHCGFDETVNVPKGYSANRGFNTSQIGLEEIYYSNYEHDIARNVYILVYSDTGIGNSEYILNSTHDLTYITSSDYERCWTVWQAWGIFAIGSIIIVTLFSKWVKKSTLTPEQKAEIAQKQLEKEKQLTQKGKIVAQKGKSNMQARKGDRRR